MAVWKITGDQDENEWSSYHRLHFILLTLYVKIKQQLGFKPYQNILFFSQLGG